MCEAGDQVCVPTFEICAAIVASKCLQSLSLVVRRIEPLFNVLQLNCVTSVLTVLVEHCVTAGT